MDYREIAKLISTSKKKTPVKAYVKGNIKGRIPKDVMIFKGEDSVILIGDYKNIEKILARNKSGIEYFHIDNDRRNSAIPLLDLKNLNCRIEPGAIIRDRVKIGKNCIIMMGAVINIGAEIGESTMIDMNAVIGSRVKVGKRVHVSAGAVLAGVLEPPSAQSVIIRDDVLIGANAVVLEGVTVGIRSVVAAGAVVTENVKPNSVVAGVPAKFIKKIDPKTDSKTQILEELRKL
ncbi:2,3,4,5-tetrahydropyridine-2,6-dicarboxylate N-acetyltransferase [candidate division KSB1 bacterium]